MVFKRGKSNKKDETESANADTSVENGEAEEQGAIDETAFLLSVSDALHPESALAGVEKAAQKMDRDARMEAKYAHLVPGSIRSVPRGEPVGSTVSKGRVATITCTECGATRDVNVQDVFQVKRCVECAKAQTLRRLDMRKATLAAKKLEDSMSDDGVLP